ncbi:uncharacterized protein SRS1_11831 [Sporisorium reilianum f. sp. reilianum]|uniref:SEC7 domain-containing protein n=1 Tax=Sporisorium reilianum f. sp. reilianum TaxID=72559 RepID=A0A2N8U7C4_9BASI|nr:uncharacterized protein SRS1_11831 [Sporisorium reilianum f. sp. reilianum]
MSSSIKHVLADRDDAASRRTSIASDHSEIPSYPRQGSIASPSDPHANNAASPHSPHSLTTRELGAKRTVRDFDENPTPHNNGRLPYSRRPDTASTTASFSSASAETPARPSLASASSRRFGSPKKPATPSRIGRDFEALLASDETYVLRESTKVTLDTEEAQSAKAQQLLLPSSSSSTNRVIVERRRQQSSSSSVSTNLDDEADDDDNDVLQALDTTPRPPHADSFQSPQRKPPQSFASSGTPVGSVSGHAGNNTRQVPTSPDRTTSLQRHLTGSSTAPSPSPKRQAAPMSAMPGFLLPAGSESGHGTVRARPRLNSSVGLEQEVNSISSSQNSADQAASTGSFRRRMKKTSGFLRRLRAQPKSSSTYASGSNPSATSLGRGGAGESSISSATLGRRGSKASVASLGASSISGSTSKNAHLASADMVAVPSIPERFMQPSSSSNSQLAAAPAAVDQSLPGVDAAAPPETQKLAPMTKSALRVPSAPAAVTEWGTADKYALPQRSSSQGHDHQRNKSLGSSDSTGAIRLAVQQLSSHMDDAWKEAPIQEVQMPDKSDAPTPPNREWGPSPQLPDLGIQHYKERSGSFLDEPEIASGSSFDMVEAAAPLTSRSVSASSHSNTPATLDSSRGPDNSKMAGLGIHAGTSSPRVQQDSDRNVESARAKANGPKPDGTTRPSRRPVPLQPTNLLRKPTLTSSPPVVDSPQNFISPRESQPDLVDPGADSTRRHTMDSSASLVSMRSFETAAESAGLDSADPKVATFSPALIEPQRTADSARIGSQGLSHDHSTVHAGSPLTAHDAPQTQSPAANEGDVSDDAENQEQSIRLVTKRSNTEDIDLSSEAHDGLTTTTIITAPASPDMDSSALPNMVELSEQSFLRPGHNGGLSRAPSVSSVSGGRRGTTGLLSTPSIRRSPSPVSSPNSARTSFDVAAVRPVNDTAAAPPPISASAKELATKCWDEDPGFLKREKIAEWLGGLGLVNRAARSYYFANFDFSGLRLDVAFRRLCDKLFLRAETQQIDRILAAFSQRYYECNPDSVFGSADVVHSVVFSILLLNTDLHIAELQERMTRQQFVRNTLGAIAESSSDEQTLVARDDSRSSFSVATNELTRSTDAVPQKVDPALRRNSISSYLVHRSKQTSSITNLETSSDAVHQDGSRPGTAASGSRGKDAEIETLLRDIYAAVKSERILLPSPETGSGPIAAGRPSGTFSPLGGGRRKMGTGSDRMMALKRGSIRGIQGLLGGGGSASLLDPALSPNPSRSSVDSWGRISQSFSTGERDGLLSPLPSITPGFASTLTQTIIKESMEEDAASGVAKASTTAETPLDEEDDDDQLALQGPPWAKEGSLTRKYFWESTGKRAKDKNWTEVFVVVSKGTLSMFRFGMGGGSAAGASSGKTKGRASAAVSSEVGAGSGAVLGGGNWLSNATCLGEIPLAHSLANALPPPGYNKTRPHVFALTLPGGRVYLFQTGHEELVNEWVSTCNYWAARQSKEPLPGGVSNMEYGWNKVLPQPDDEYEELDSSNGYPASSRHAAMARSSSSQPHASSSADSQSVQSSTLRARLASPATSAAASVSTSSNLGYLTHERTFINEWRTPQLPAVASTLTEERQLLRLEKQVRTLEAELTLHNELRQPMLQLYSPKGANYGKALGNWERKSNYLLQELVKYQSYVEILRKSADSKAERRAKREVEEMVREGDEMLAGLEI